MLYVFWFVDCFVRVCVRASVCMCVCVIGVCNIEYNKNKIQGI